MNERFDKNEKPKDTALRVYCHGTSKEDVDNAIFRFKRRIEKSGILQEYKDRQFYLKPSLKKKEKQKKALTYKNN